MDAATAIYLAKGILDFSVLSTSLSYEEILAIKAALPSMELTPQQKKLVIGRMRSKEVGYEIEANKRLTAKLREQRAARQERMREAAARKESESLSYWFNKISQRMQEWFSPYYASYQRVPDSTAQQQDKRQ